MKKERTAPLKHLEEFGEMPRSNLKVTIKDFDKLIAKLGKVYEKTSRYIENLTISRELHKNKYLQLKTKYFELKNDN